MGGREDGWEEVRTTTLILVLAGARDGWFAITRDGFCALPLRPHGYQDSFAGYRSPEYCRASSRTSLLVKCGEDEPEW